MFLVVALYQKGFLILGGEGNYFLNPDTLFNFNGYAWKSLESAGYPNPIINYSFLIFNFILGLWKSGISYNIINFLLIFLAYSGPMLSMYWLARKVFGLKGLPSTLIALFYILNPFSAFHIQEMMFWNIAPLVFLPIFYGILSLNYYDNTKLFFFAGITVLLGAFSLSNIPYLGIFQFFVLISLFVIPLLQDRKFSIKEYLVKLIIVESAFVFFSSWWLFNLIRMQVQGMGAVAYTKDFAIGWARYASGDGDIIQKLFSFKALIPNGDSNYFSRFYNGVPGSIIMVLPFLVFIYSLVIIKDKKILRRISFLCLILLAIMFLNKGVNQPLSFLYVLMLEKIPFFIIFKSPLEKFSALFLFFFAITMLSLMASKKHKVLNYAFAIYVLFAAIPFITLSFIPDFSIGVNKYISRRFILKQEYRQVITILNSDKLSYRYLSLPGSLNYQVTMANEGNKYYRGMDPLLYAINKPFIAAYSVPAFNVIYNNLSNKNIENIMGAFSTRKIMLNSDIIPSFGFLEKESPTESKAIFSSTMANKQFGNVSLYTLNSYIPIMYTPTREININNPTDDPANELSRMTSTDFISGSAIFSKNSYQSVNDQIIDFPEENRPTLEFKKINEVKYRVVVHGLKQKIPLIFNESFDKQWKLFQSPISKEPDKIDATSEPSNEEDGATKEEIASFINKKVISKTADDQGKNDFISKSFNKTIQNDNLSKGKFFEIWSELAVEEGSHSEVNGYANSWILNPEDLCKNNSKCVTNSDGSYDTELVVEFLPQKLYYLGWLITVGALIFSILAAIYVHRRKKQ